MTLKACVAIAFSLCLPMAAAGSTVEAADVQPLAAQARRLLAAAALAGEPLSVREAAEIDAAAKAGSAERIERILDAHSLWVVTIPPSGALQVEAGAAKP